MRLYFQLFNPIFLYFKSFFVVMVSNITSHKSYKFHVHPCSVTTYSVYMLFPPCEALSNLRSPFSWVFSVGCGFFFLFFLTAKLALQPSLNQKKSLYFSFFLPCSEPQSFQLFLCFCSLFSPPHVIFVVLSSCCCCRPVFMPRFYWLEEFYASPSLYFSSP